MHAMYIISIMCACNMRYFTVLYVCNIHYYFNDVCMQYALLFWYYMHAMLLFWWYMHSICIIIWMLYARNTHTQTANIMYVFLSQMILFSSCCICGLISGILNFQFVRALVKRPDAMRSLHLAIMSLACLGISSCTLSTWLTCRLASSEQQRMFLEREHSLHHSHEMAEKVCQELVCLCGLCVPVYLIHLQSTLH